jgi:hypothetical protein
MRAAAASISSSGLTSPRASRATASRAPSRISSSIAVRA